VRLARSCVRDVFSLKHSASHGQVFERSGLYRISKHFKFALESAISERRHSHAVLLEDDLLISPDLLRYFWSVAWLLEKDPTLWCASAWNDQGFPHTTWDARGVGRTDYFPGLGWMLSAGVWDELRAKWPERATTGWDHWMRLSTTSKGRECLRPEINRSRHASSRGTNVVNNKPFERFTFERTGVDSFGDLSYLLQPAYESATAQLLRTAKPVSVPEGRDSLERWLTKLPTDVPSLLLYVREEYQALAKRLGLWGENPRATHNGTITLRLPSRATLVLADRRRCPYLPPALRETPADGSFVVAKIGKSCDEACRDRNEECISKELEWANSCEVMRSHFKCEAGCGHQVGAELPAYASSKSLDTYQQCLISDIAFSKCDAKYAKTTRLCRCVRKAKL